MQQSFFDSFEQLVGSLSDDGTWTEDSCNTHLVQRVIIIRGHYTAYNNKNVLASKFGQFITEFRHKRQVPCSK